MHPVSVGVDLDPQAFDEQIFHHGVVFRHFRGMRNPVGLVEKYDTRRPDEDHSGASNGLLYTQAGCIACIFTGNTKEIRAMEGGMLNSGVAQITVARFYVDKPQERVYLSPMDRLEVEGDPILVPHKQLVDYNASGDDRLKFPAERVLDLVDASGVRYEEGADFCLHDGRIRWKGKRPGVNPETMVGKVYAVNFLYKACWFIERLLHEIRLARTEDMAGNRRMEQMQQSAIVAREYIFHNQANDPQAPNPSSQRQEPAPADGGFGPR